MRAVFILIMILAFTAPVQAYSIFDYYKTPQMEIAILEGGTVSVNDITITVNSFTDDYARVSINGRSYSLLLNSPIDISPFYSRVTNDIEFTGTALGVNKWALFKVPSPLGYYTKDGDEIPSHYDQGRSNGVWVDESAYCPGVNGRTSNPLSTDCQVGSEPGTSTGNHEVRQNDYTTTSTGRDAAIVYVIGTRSSTTIEVDLVLEEGINYYYFSDELMVRIVDSRTTDAIDIIVGHFDQAAADADNVVPPIVPPQTEAPELPDANGGGPGDGWNEDSDGDGQQDMTFTQWLLWFFLGLRTFDSADIEVIQLTSNMDVSEISVNGDKVSVAKTVFHDGPRDEDAKDDYRIVVKDSNSMAELLDTDGAFLSGEDRNTHIVNLQGLEGSHSLILELYQEVSNVETLVTTVTTESFEL